MTVRADQPEAGRTYGVSLVRGPFVSLPSHEDAVETVDELSDLVDHLEGPLAVDLFCGAGGLSLGLTEAGFKVVLGVDHDDPALETHRAYHPGLSVDWDLSDESIVEQVGELVRDLGIDLVAGGPPCQPFSRAGRSLMRDLVRNGKRPAHDARSELWQSFLRVVEIGRPSAVLMENVPDMALDRDMWILRAMVDELELMGYSVSERVVATRDYGVPQHRQRLILIALADGVAFDWPDATGELVSLRAAISDLPTVEGGWRPQNGDDPDDPAASGWAEYDAPESEFQREMREGMDGTAANRVFDHITRPVRPDDAKAFAAMDSKTKYSDLDPTLQRYRTDIFDDKYKRLDWDELSRTITAHIAKDGYWYIHPAQDRTITVREAARIQTFPDRIRFAGPPSAAFRQIGNAVPPRLAQHLGSAVLRSLQARCPSTWSTEEVSLRLSRWFLETMPRAVPWLVATERWQVIQAETLWARLGMDHVGQAWDIVKPLETPEATLEPANRDLLALYARLRGREDRVDSVVQAAEWLTAHPRHLDSDLPAARLREIPGVSPAVADLASRVCLASGVDREEPVLATTGTVRVAARFFGDSDLENRRRNTDGRLAVARMIGGEDRSHEAHLALIEIAAGLCSTSQPDCGHCPLRDDCAWAGSVGYQQTLTSPSPAP